MWIQSSCLSKWFWGDAGSQQVWQTRSALLAMLSWCKGSRWVSAFSRSSGAEWVRSEMRGQSQITQAESVCCWGDGSWSLKEAVAALGAGSGLEAPGHSEAPQLLMAPVGLFPCGWVCPLSCCTKTHKFGLEYCLLELQLSWRGWGNLYGE